jgi:hypothetical protein
MPMESIQELTSRALRIQSEAIVLTQNICGDNSELNKWMAIAKKMGMKWVEGLTFSIERMRVLNSAVVS